MSPIPRIALLLVVYVAIVLVPVALAGMQGLPRRPLWDELSSGLAMTSFAVVLMEFFLSGRYRALSAAVGMDVTMRFHRIMALAALVFLLIHPLLYTLPYADPLPWDTARLQSVTQSTAALLSGLAAWILLAVLVAMAVIRARLSFTYESWRLSHGIGAFLIAALGTLHGLDSGRYAQDAATRAFWLAGLVLAGLALIHVYVFKPLLQARRPYRVAAVDSAGERLWRLVIEPRSNTRFRFAAGQFVWLKLQRAFGRITEHPFSIASAPSVTPRLEFVIKEGGDFTDAIGRVAVGTPAYVDGPYGNFTLHGRTGTGVMLIAGGVGIAPILSLARELTAQADPRPVKLLYADRSMQQIVARAELDRMAARHGFEVIYMLAHPPADWSGLTGVLDQQNLSCCIPSQAADRWLYYVCGPPAMIDAVELSLARLGVPLTQIVSEHFTYVGAALTPRERLTRAVVAGVVAVQLLAALIFAAL